jgi:hypothetical protein
MLSGCTAARVTVQDLGAAHEQEHRAKISEMLQNGVDGDPEGKPYF